MADDNDDWFGGGDDEPAATETGPAATGTTDAPAAAAAAGGGAEAPEAAKAGDADGGADEVEEEEEPEYLDPDKLLLFKHWIRPKFLPYKYITEYRKNYYDDVIDYMDKRNRGITRDIPVAQTWAERALRSYTKNMNQCDILKRKLADKKLVEDMKFSGKFYLHHSKNSINARYANILF